MPVRHLCRRVALLASATAMLAVTTAAAADDASTSTSDPRALAAGDALRVVVAPDGDRELRTADGRTVRLRGANVNALVDYAGARDVVPVTAADGEQARALGLSVVRLAVSWSRIAPVPGQIDQAYLDQVRTTARAFADRGVRVLLDPHQDRYAAGLGPSGDESDGAPAWAALTGGASTAQNSGGHPYYGTAASRAAAKAFFDDATVAGKGLQQHYADVVARLAGIAEELGPGSAGVELYNEPVDPWGTDPTATDTFSPTKLWPFYRRLIDRLRGPDGTGPGGGAYDGPIWFEPQATRTQTDDDAVAARFSDDPGLVYAPHIYTDVYNGQIGTGTYAKLERSFDNAVAEARRYGAALAPDELPGASTGPWELHRGEVLRHLDRLDIGGIVWVWKQAAGPSDYGWGVLRADGGQRDGTAIARDYGRPRLQASGTATATSSWSDGVLTVRTSGAGVVDLWDGARFADAAPSAGVAPVVTIDGAAPAPGTLTGRRAVSRLSSATEWAGGRELRLSVPAGDHVVVLRPAGAGESATPAPAPADGTATTTTPTTTTTTPTTTTTTPTTTATTPATTSTTPAPAPAPQAASGVGGNPIAGLVGAVGSLAGAVLDPVRGVAAQLTGAARPAASGSTAASTGTARPTAPAVTALRASPTRFRPATAGRGGTRVSVVVARASTVRLTIERRVAAATRSRACAPKVGTDAACARWVRVATQTHRVRAGRATVPVSGRVKGRALPAGHYRATVAPTGSGAVARSVALTVLRASR